MRRKKRRGFSQNEALQFARVLVTSRIDSEGWWRHCSEAEEFKAAHGHCNFPPGTALDAWQHKARKYWNQKKLSERQISALNKLGIKRNSAASHGLPGRGSTIEKLMDLREKVKKEITTDEERAEYEALMNAYIKRHDQGRLTLATARALGLERF